MSYRVAVVPGAVFLTLNATAFEMAPSAARRLAVLLIEAAEAEPGSYDPNFPHEMRGPGREREDA